MLADHISEGQIVKVKTKGGAPPFKAPPLTFFGQFKEETGLSDKEGYINLTYQGKVARLNGDGKVIGFVKGEKVMSIPRVIVQSIELRRKKVS